VKIRTSTGRILDRADFDKAPTFKAVIRRKAGASSDSDRFEFEMGISHLSVDRDDEAISKAAWDKSIGRFMDSPAVAIGHTFDAAEAVNIGRVTSFAFEGKQAVASGYLGRTAPAMDVRMNLEDDIPMQASIAFRALEGRDATEEDKAIYGPTVKRIFEDMDILHFGIVNVGAHPRTYTRKKDFDALLKGPNAEKARALMDAMMAGLNAAAKAGADMQALMEGMDGGGEDNPPPPDEGANPPPPPPPKGITDAEFKGLLDSIMPVVSLSDKKPAGSPPAAKP